MTFYPTSKIFINKYSRYKDIYKCLSQYFCYRKNYKLFKQRKLHIIEELKLLNEPTINDCYCDIVMTSYFMSILKIFDKK